MLLGIPTQDALSNHVDDEDKNTVAIYDGIPGNPNKVIINESEFVFLLEGCSWMEHPFVIMKLKLVQKNGVIYGNKEWWKAVVDALINELKDTTY